jgi:hypothetical protein
MASVIKKGKAVRSTDGLAGGWITTSVGALVLIAMGFGLGIVVGVVSKEPELMGGHVAGRSETIDWSAAAGEVSELPAVSASGFVEDGPAVDLPVLGEPEPATARAVASIEKVPAAAARTPEPEPTRVAAASQGSFGVQVGAFEKGAAAEEMAADLRGRGYPTVVSPSAGARDKRWRVRVGPVETRAEADELARELQKKEQLPTWVLSDVSS